MTDPVQQANNLYLRLVKMQMQLQRNWEHMPTLDYKAQDKRLARLIRKASARMERRYFAAFAAEEV